MPINNKCIDCFFCVPHSGQESAFLCHYEPPKVHIVPSQTSLGQIQLTTVTAYPALDNKTIGCSHFTHLTPINPGVILDKD